MVLILAALHYIPSIKKVGSSIGFNNFEPVLNNGILELKAGHRYPISIKMIGLKLFRYGFVGLFKKNSYTALCISVYFS